MQRATTYLWCLVAASWGTRRNEPSLLHCDLEERKGGSFLSIFISKIKGKDHNDRPSLGLFEQGLDRLATIVRQRSDSKLKRARSMQNIAEQRREHSQGSLASPPRTSAFSFSRRPTPNINTTMAATTCPPAAIGTIHAHSGSVTATSPESPPLLRFARFVISGLEVRAR